MSFPCLLSIPHGGILVPPEVKELILLREEDLLRDGDPFTGELYDLPAASVVRMEIARAVVDVNRAPG
ncbi:MAG TPA: N-formylglutamate amidohydrolase, partial [Aquifex aeolicus]|nr:N-formylglutamate amidohydrolase [Aquifex aeolicus]